MATKRDPTDTVDIKIRMREPLRAEIESAAKERAVSMNAEMIDRLERSFSEEARSRALMGDALDLRYGEKLSALLQILAAVIEAAGRYGDLVTRHGMQSGPWRNDWMANPYAFDRVRDAVAAAMKELMPPGVIVPPPPITQTETSDRLWGLSARQFLLKDPWEKPILDALAGHGALDKKVSEFLQPLIGRLDPTTTFREEGQRAKPTKRTRKLRKTK